MVWLWASIMVALYSSSTHRKDIDTIQAQQQVIQATQDSLLLAVDSLTAARLTVEPVRRTTKEERQQKE